MNPLHTPGESRAAAVELIGEELAVRWEDGHESYYTPALLREHCPCAICKVKRERDAGGPGQPGAETAKQRPAGVSPSLRLIDAGRPAVVSPRIARIEPVGRYAVRFHWTDRHDSGIYDFRLLRGLCPCAECRSRNPADAEE